MLQGHCSFMSYKDGSNFNTVQHEKRWQAPPRTFLLFVTGRASFPHCVNYSLQLPATSQQLFSQAAEDHRSSLVYLHLKRWNRPHIFKEKSITPWIVSTTQWVYKTATLCLTGAEKRGRGPHFTESGADFFIFFRAKLRQKL